MSRKARLVKDRYYTQSLDGVLDAARVACKEALNEGMSWGSYPYGFIHIFQVRGNCPLINWLKKRGGKYKGISIMKGDYYRGYHLHIDERTVCPSVKFGGQSMGIKRRIYRAAFSKLKKVEGFKGGSIYSRMD